MVALLICHGALGGLHLFCAPSGVTVSTGTHAAATHTTASHGQKADPDHGGCLVRHGAGGEYYAALLGALLASALLLAFGAQRRRGVREQGRPYEEALPLWVPILPRGPTLARLQVFRL